MTEPTAPPPRRSFGPAGGPIAQRLASALALRHAFYRTAADDVGGTGPLGGFVCFIALLRESGTVYGLSQVERFWGVALLVVALLALLRWLAVGAVALGVARLGRSAAPFTRLLRTLGYADAPTIFIAIAPWLTPALYLPAHLGLLAWAFAATWVALRAATGAAGGRAALLAVPVFLAQQFTLALIRL